MKKFLFLSLCVATLMSCGQKQGPSEQEIQERNDAAVKEAVNAEGSEINTNSDYTDGNTVSESLTNQAESRKKAMYEAGKSWAKYCKEMSESTFKERYQRDCNDDEVTNRELYQEYKRGFYDGVKELSGLDDNSVATTTASESRKKAMYEAGKSWAKYCKEMSESTFKERYQKDCNDDEVTNRELYQEYKRGFYDGVKELSGL